VRNDGRYDLCVMMGGMICASINIKIRKLKQMYGLVILHA